MGPPAWSSWGFLTAGRLRGRQLLPGGSGSTMRLLEKPAEATSPLWPHRESHLVKVTQHQSRHTLGYSETRPDSRGWGLDPNSAFEGKAMAQWDLTSFSAYRQTTCSPTSRRASALCLWNTGFGTWGSCLRTMESSCPRPVWLYGSVNFSGGLSLLNHLPCLPAPLAGPPQ